MSYSFIVNLIFWIISGVIGLLTIHFLFFSIVGLFTYKKFPKAKTQHKYGIIIPARNEDKVIGNLIKSIQKNDYPQELLQIFVIAHNCTDKTAEVSRSLGATVYEYSNKDEKTKGYALKYLFECIDKEYGIENYDGFICLDADNILSKNYIEKLNDAFDAEHCESIITSFRNSKNFNSNMISGLYGLFFINNCRLESRGRTVCGCSTRVQGTGFVISSKIVKDGWQYVTLTEDWELSADQVLNGNRIVYCDEAVFYDEQPLSIKVMLRQRLRWAKGHLLVCITRCGALFKSLFSCKKTTAADGTVKKNNKFSKFDIFVNCLPMCVITGFLSIISFILTACGMFFEPDPIIYLKQWGISFGITLAIGYVLLLLNAIAIFILEHKRIKNVSFIKRVGMTLLWPLFIAISFPLEFVALFSKNIVWKTIPHTDTTNFEALNESTKEIAEPEKLIAASTENTDESTLIDLSDSDSDLSETPTSVHKEE